RDGDGRRGGDASRLHGRRDGRSLVAARQDRGDGPAWRLTGDPRAGPAVGDVRVLDGPAVHVPGSGRLLDAVRALRGSAEVQGGRDHRQGEGISDWQVAGGEQANVASTT